MSNAPPPRRVLACSVGGSPGPIRMALAQMEPDRVVFIVSDGASGASSRDQVEQERLADSAPGLRHADGCPKDVAILAVPTDDPDRAYALIESRLAIEIAGGHAVTADYTGGTKSMSGAFFLIATALPDVVLQFMQGERPDLVRLRLRVRLILPCLGGGFA